MASNESLDSVKDAGEVISQTLPEDNNANSNPDIVPDAARDDDTGRPVSDCAESRPIQSDEQCMVSPQGSEHVPESSASEEKFVSLPAEQPLQEHSKDTESRISAYEAAAENALPAEPPPHLEDRGKFDATDSSVVHCYGQECVEAELNNGDKDTQEMVHGQQKTIEVPQETVQGHQETVQGHQETVQGHQETVQGQQEMVQGHHYTVQGHQGEENDDNETQITVDADLWSYLKKTESRWKNDVRNAKESFGADVEETVVEERIRLSISGTVDDNARKANLELCRIIAECKGTVSTLEVPCNDNQTHSKISRLLKAINRLPSFVSVIPDAVRVTGTREEIETCIQKLTTYGLHYELPQPEAVSVEQAHPVTEESAEDGNSELENANMDGSICRDLPFPIEKHLWDFIMAKRASEIRDIEKGFDVTVRSSPTSDVATVMVSVSASSKEKLEHLRYAEEALCQLMGKLGKQIVVTTLMEGAPASALTKEMLNSISNDLRDIDMIVQRIESRRMPQNSGHRLIAIGLEKELQLSRNTICEALQKLHSSIEQYFEPPQMPRNSGGGGGSKFPGEGYSLSDFSRNGAQNAPAGIDPLATNMPTDDWQLPDGALGPSRLQPISEEGGEDKRPDYIDTSSSSEDEIEEENEKEKSSEHAMGSRGDLSKKRDDPGERVEELACSLCDGKRYDGSAQDPGCRHVLCVMCIEQFCNTSSSCLLCNARESAAASAAVTQPSDGRMLITYDNLNRLPGFSNSSNGIIIITYLFKPGVQPDDFPHPGKPYSGLIKTAFLPNNREGLEVLDLLQRAFESRLTFRIAYTRLQPDGELAWNGILHKDNIFGGKEEGGYPDPGYLENVRKDLQLKGVAM